MSDTRAYSALGKRVVSASQHLDERKHHMRWRILVQGFDYRILKLNACIMNGKGVADIRRLP